MTAVTREQVSLALFNLLLGSAVFQTSGRRFQMWDTVPQDQQPALFLVKHGEDHVKNKNQTPAVRTLSFDCWIYTSAGQNLSPGVVPSTQLDNIIDAIDPTSGGVLKPGFHGRQTLGGLVIDCFIDGKIAMTPGDLNGQGVAVIPIKVVFM